MKHSLPCWNHWMLDVGTQQPADGSKRHAGYAKADGTRQDCKRIKKKKKETAVMMLSLLRPSWERRAFH